MILLSLSLVLLALGAVFSFPRGGGGTRLPGQPLAVAGSGLAALAGLVCLLGDRVGELVLPWSLPPMGSFHLGMDGLSSLFVTLTATVSFLAAVYGNGYLRGADRGRVRGSWLFFNLLVLSMLLVVTARNGILFLVSWEIMSLSSFFLVMFNRQQEEVGRAGWTYLVATHLGTALLLVMFLLLDGTGTMDFGGFAPPAGQASAVFVLAVLGFGTKAGFVPLHVWLPDAHPAAPSHVSAVMSGVMIKTGIYGILRVLTLLGTPLAWWAWTLLLFGAVSGIVGVLFALAQDDLKRLLAYSSVENVGIIAMGLGIGLMGLARGSASVAVLGLAGGLMHVVNHGVFKSLLFMGAGSVSHAAGTLRIDRLGGLLRRMPLTGASFLTGSAAICALPPLNGFVGEFLIFSAGLVCIAAGGPLSMAGAVVIGGLALTGGLAAVCFTKAFGVVFLGEPRGDYRDRAVESNRSMQVPMAVLAGLCFGLGLGAPWVFHVLGPAVATLLPHMMPASLPEAVAHSLKAVSALGAILLLLTGGLALARKRLLRGRTVSRAVTWGCAYGAVTPRMQYTGTSYAEPTVNLFRTLLRPGKTGQAPRGLMPRAASLHTRVDELFRVRLYRPLFLAIIRVAGLLRLVHQGQTNLYVLYVALTTFALLLWRLR